MATLKLFLSVLPLFGASSLAANVQVTTGTKYQQVDGFGFSQAFSRAAEFQSTSSTLQKQALDFLFSTSTGAGFSIIRNRIPSGSDSIEPNSPGSPSGTPSYKWDNNDEGQVWFSKQAVSYGVKTIYADAWSAPGYMKTSGNEATAGYLCGTTGHSCSSGDWRQAYANYLVQYVKYYAQAGLTVTHLGFLNEPDFSPSYSQMQISSNAAEAVSFIPTLYNTVKAAGLSTKITCCDAVGWPDQTRYTQNLVSSGVTQYLGLITSHTYSGDANSVQGTTLPVWVTEAGVGTAFVTTWYSNGAANEGMTWANKLSTGFLSANLSAYLYWEGFENNQKQSGSHLVDVNGSSAQPSGIFYAFAMWSRFIRPGAARVGTSGSVSGTAIAAFSNTDGSVVVVLTNSGGSAQSATVSVSDKTVSNAQAWVTDQTHSIAGMTASLSGGSVTVSVPAHGVVTVKLT